MGRYRELLLNTVLFAVNSVATRLISFVLVPLYTSYMSAGEYGITDMALTVIGLMTPLATLSIADAAIRYIVANRGDADRIVAVSVLVTLLSIPVVSVLTPLLDLDVFGGLGAFRGWFVLAYATSALMGLCGEIARGIGNVKLIPVCAVISSALTLLTALATIGGGHMGVVGYFISTSVGPAAAIAVYMSVGGIGRLALHGGRDLIAGGMSALKSTLAPMARYAMPLIPNALFWWVGTSISRLFITGMLGITLSGMYAAASKIPNLLNTAYSIFQQAWQLSVFREAQDEGIASFYATVFRLLQAALTVLCALLSLLSPVLAGFLLRGETSGSWPMISILLMANLMNVFNAFYGTIYTSTLHTSYIMKTTVIGAASCVVLTPLAILAFGIYGACAASAISQAVVFVLRAVDSRKYIRFEVGWPSLLVTIAALTIQSVVTAFQVDGWACVSAICFAVVAVIQGIRALPLLKHGISAALGDRA